MALIRWEPVTELNTIQNEMNRLFNTFFDQPGSSGTAQSSSRRWIPAMDLVETADHYLVRADLPGVPEEDVTVQMEDNVLTIAGQRTVEHEQKEGYYRLERAFGSFSRSLTLPDGVNPDQVTAHFNRGVLEITIPKPEQKKPRQVQIHLGSSAKEPATLEGSEVGDSNKSSEKEYAVS
ncbi:MAG TPA: Hsp20/alpha crystallin family protein [Solirubrobacteraceae bacterium]|nr:Hsp20/alpha crystallin family protein [Solirubrobacteraceae bacterium]